MYTLIERSADGQILDIMQLGDIRDAWRIYHAACRFYSSLFRNCNHDVAVRMMAGGLPPMCASPRLARTVQLITQTTEMDPFTGIDTYTFVVTRY